MKKIALSTLFLVNFAFAQQLPPVPPQAFVPPSPLTASFSRGIPLPEFTRIVLEDVLRVPFVLPPEFLLLTDSVGVSLKQLEKKQALEVLQTILYSRDFELKTGPVYFVNKLTKSESKKTEEPREIFVFKPKNRPVVYFQEQLPGLFPSIYFTFAKRQNSSDSSSPLTSTEKREKDADPLDTFFAHVPVSQLPELKRVLNALDTPLPQVRIRASLYEVATSNSDGNGVSVALSLLSDKLKINLGDTPSKSSIAFKTPAVSAVFSTLDGDSRFKSLASPEILASTGKQALLQVGGSVPVLSSTTTSDGQTTQSVQYRDTGVILKLKPEVFTDTVQISVDFEISDAVQTATGVDGSPTFTKRQFQAVPVIKPGETLILGGLLSDRLNKTRSRFFSFNTSSSSSTSRSELVLVLHVDDSVKGGREDESPASATP